jgi:hypothetical protein
MYYLPNNFVERILIWLEKVRIVQLPTNLLTALRSIDHLTASETKTLPILREIAHIVKDYSHGHSRSQRKIGVRHWR